MYKTKRLENKMGITKTRQIMGAIASILSQVFGVGYLLWSIIGGGYTPEAASQVVNNIIQLALMLAIVIGFFDDRKRLLFGAVFVSMSYNGIAYLVDDFATLHPIDQFFTNNTWPYATASMIYFVVDVFWVFSIALVLFGVFDKRGIIIMRIAAAIFWAGSIALMLGSIFYGIDAVSSPSSALEIVGCLGDSFALLSYALALLFIFVRMPGEADEPLFDANDPLQ